MGLILSDAVRFAQTPLPLDSLDGGERGTDDVLGNLHHPLQCFPVGGSAAVIYHTVTQYVSMLSIVQR